MNQIPSIKCTELTLALFKKLKIYKLTAIPKDTRINNDCMNNDNTS